MSLVTGPCGRLEVLEVADGSDVRQPTITVTGVGSVDADPDRVEVHLVLASEDPDRQKAFQQVSSRSQKLAKLLDSLEVAGHVGTRPG